MSHVVTLEDRFRGSCNLVVLHLRRVALSTDLEEGFDAARARHMLSAEQEAFIRRCLALEERLQNGDAPDEPITEDDIKQLQRCTLSLNSADSA